MDRARLDPLLTRVLLDILSDRIAAMLKARSRSALVLFSGTDLGLDAAIAELAKLADAGWTFEVHCTADATELLAPPRLRALGGGREIAISVDGQPGLDVEAVLARHSLVLVPALSVAVAARVALGLAEDAVSRLLSGAIERSRRVVAVRDGCCPASRDRIARGLTGNAAYRDMMASHLKRIESFGVELTWAARLESAVADARPLVWGAADPCGGASPASGHGHETARGQVLGWSEAKGVTTSELRVPRDMLITPLAAEELKARQVRLVRE